MLLALSLTAH